MMRSFLIMLIACYGTSALGQTSPLQDSTLSKKSASPGVINYFTGSGNFDSPLSALSAIEVNAGEDGSNLAIRISHPISDVGGRFHAFGLTVGAPIDKQTSSTFSALDPFANGVYLEGKYTFTQLLGRLNPNPSAPLELCRSIERRSGAPLNGNCTSEYVATNERSRLDEFDNLFYFSNATLLFAGVSGRVGREEFEFLNATTAASTAEARTPWSVGGFIGFSRLEWRNSFTIDFRHQTKFKAAAASAVCLPGATVCAVNPVGQPTESEQNVLGGEYRQRVGKNFAFSIRGSYDLTGKIFVLDLPVYFISDGSLGLNAGVRARYIEDPDTDNEDEGWVFGVFVSKSFSLFQ